MYLADSLESLLTLFEQIHKCQAMTGLSVLHPVEEILFLLRSVLLLEVNLLLYFCHKYVWTIHNDLIQSILDQDLPSHILTNGLWNVLHFLADHRYLRFSYHLGILFLMPLQRSLLSLRSMLLVNTGGSDELLRSYLHKNVIHMPYHRLHMFPVRSFHELVEYVHPLFSLEDHQHASAWKWSPYPDMPLLDLLCRKNLIRDIFHWTWYLHTDRSVSVFPHRYQIRQVYLMETLPAYEQMILKIQVYMCFLRLRYIRYIFSFLTSPCDCFYKLLCYNFREWSGQIYLRIWVFVCISCLQLLL